MRALELDKFLMDQIAGLNEFELLRAVQVLADCDLVELQLAVDMQLI